VFLAGSHLHVENCVISGLAQNGVYAASVGSNLHVSDTVVRETAGDGVLLQGGMLVTFERVQIKHSTGVALQIMEGAIASIRDSAFANNDAGGIEVDANIGDFSKALIQGSQIVFNGGHGVSAIATLGKHALVTIESSNVSNNANSGVFAQTSSGGTIWLAARDNMLDNNVVGYNLVTSLPVDSLIATLADNLIHDQTGSGIRTVNYGSITVTVSGNTITRNANFGISVDAGVSAQTPQNNVVVNNLYGDIGGTGTLTTIPLH
jgi:hypothetical protein